ncbi:Uncharacterised protein [Candidatus Venteria ishoeyi]|uniref:Uncharacterized protein n=1 Tax=Candidatus Venteria ishoeyi TaxID=1899563 RepID=A0A1H6FGI8_9GAMM|nr:Uncharacterised protein [Candidatus Venteria ishoeyi]SEH09301.1 Uncharacterised protein [Candidatus Venteria ishoeyi]
MEYDDLHVFEKNHPPFMSEEYLDICWKKKESKIGK